MTKRVTADAKKKTTTKKPKRLRKIVTGEVAEIKTPRGTKSKKMAVKKKKVKPKKTELQPMDNAAVTLLPRQKKSSLIQWFNLYSD